MVDALKGDDQVVVPWIGALELRDEALSPSFVVRVRIPACLSVREQSVADGAGDARSRLLAGGEDDGGDEGDGAWRHGFGVEGRFVGGGSGGSLEEVNGEKVKLGAEVWLERVEGPGGGEVVGVLERLGAILSAESRVEPVDL